MKRIRVIPVLLLSRNGMVKTVCFRKPRYIGDPINAVKILNDKLVDELLVLDIEAGARHAVDFDRIEDIVGEAFMPVAYGGGVGTSEQCGELLRRGVEKVVLNTSAFLNPGLIEEAANRFGSQSIVVSIDARKNVFGQYRAYVQGAKKDTGITPCELAKQSVSRGAGEIILTSVEREGTFQGYDIPLLRSVTEAVDVPVIAHGGAKSITDFCEAVLQGGCSGVAAGSMFVFARQGEGVLINYPAETDLQRDFWRRIE